MSECVFLYQKKRASQDLAELRRLSDDATRLRQQQVWILIPHMREENENESESVRELIVLVFEMRKRCQTKKFRASSCKKNL